MGVVRQHVKRSAGIAGLCAHESSIDVAPRINVF